MEDLQRLHRDSTTVYPGYTGQPFFERRSIAFTVNPYRNRRLELMAGWSVIAERGIDLAALPPESRVADYIEQQQWTHFIRTPRRYDTELVRDFYASMRPGAFKEFSVVVVRGIPVTISPSLINDYYRTIDDWHNRTSMSFGLRDEPMFRTELCPLIAGALRTSRDTVWEYSGDDQLYKRDIYPDLAFLFLFLRCNMLPSLNANALDQKAGNVVYSIQRGWPIDVGYLIWMEIADSGDITNRGSLKFPCLISHFLEQAGVLGDYSEKG